MASEAMEFDPSMKKKKTSKKSVAFDDPDTAQVAADTVQPPGKRFRPDAHTWLLTNVGAGEAEEDLFAGKKKKAKKILKDTSAFDDDNDDDASAGAGDAAEAVGDDLDFSNLKKKKKKRVIDTEVAELEAKLEEAGIVDDRDQELEGDDPFGKGEGDEAGAEDDDRKVEEEAWLKSDRDYTYEEAIPTGSVH
jgi:translation initiation factor 2 subunit 2